MSQRYAPGVRVEIRDAEWRIKCIDRTSDGGELLTCEGLSELVRGREATFLTKIEPSIRILAPEDTVLVDDTSSAYRASRLYLATLIRQAPPVDRTMIYEAPLFKTNREENYGTAWTFFMKHTVQTH